LHLDGTDAPWAQTFRALLGRLAAEAEETPTEIYVLGDLFEFWEEYHRQVREKYERDLKALEDACKAGIQLWLLSGNRDFLYGRYVRDRLGANLMGDGGSVTLSDERRAWLEHGDLLCTADVRYLRYRRWVRSPLVRLGYRLMPWFLAEKVVGRVSAKSHDDCRTKDGKVFELNLDAAKQRLQATGCRVLMCGHTHRPQAADLGGGLRLLVLPAWCDSCSGYRERHGSLRPVHFRADGSPVPATPTGEAEPQD
jgi:UDP-2,3-diacylglucosamine hydrolase